METVNSQRVNERRWWIFAVVCLSLLVIIMGLALLLLLAFAIWETKARRPMLDVRLFRDARFSAASLVLTLSSFATSGILLLLTQYLQFVVNQTPLQAGVALMPLVPTLLLGSIVAPRLSERLGPKLPVAIGLCIVASGVGGLAFVQRDSGYLPVALMLLIAGLGIGLAAAPAATSIMDALPVARAGVGSAVNDTTRQVGGALGVAVLGSVLSTVYRDALERQAAALVGQLPPALGAAVRDSIGKAVVVAGHLPPPAQALLRSAAEQAFIDAFDPSALVTVSVLVVGALVALLFLPARGRRVSGSGESVPEAGLTLSESPTTMEAREEQSAHDHTRI